MINVNSRYKRRNVKELYKMLHKCNEQLQQFSHVNKKALDQYVNFTEQREELQRRQAELDAGDEVYKACILWIWTCVCLCFDSSWVWLPSFVLHQSWQKIKELISVLDMRKDESIERTFKGVAKHFREVFSQLVQGGYGFLVMMKKKVCFVFHIAHYVSFHWATSCSFSYFLLFCSKFSLWCTCNKQILCIWEVSWKLNHNLYKWVIL